MILGLFQTSFSQTEDLSDEILVYILPDSLELPDKTIEVTDTKKLKIKSKSLDKAFKKIELKLIKKAFPEFSNEDTVKFSSTGEKIKLPNMSRIFRLKLKKKNDLEEVIGLLSKEKGVLFAEPNMDAKLFYDEDYTKQWHLNNTGQSGGSIDADIDAEEAWQIFTGNSGVKIGIIDSGVDLLHEDLSGKSTGDQTTGDYHGTHVAGIAAAKANNTHGGRGVDWNAQIVSKQIFDGSGNYMGDVNTYNKIVSAVNAGANILNNSWGGTSYSSTVRFAFAYAYKHNRVSTVAMGNYYLSGNPTNYPAAFGQGIIAVGSTTDQDSRSDFSQTGNHIDVTAPGGINPYPYNNQHDIWSTWDNNDYRYLAGTSMATPVVSGIASLLRGYDPDLSNDDIENIIRISADDKGDAGFDTWYGAGRVNAKKALDYLRSPYTLNQLFASGGSDYSSTGTYQMTIYGASGLADGVYIVKRHEVRKSVTFPAMYDHYAWGRGVGTNGWSLENPNYAMGFCEVVPGTLTSNSAVLRTYVYEVWSILGQPLGYYPTTPSNVSFKYTVLGKQITAPIISSLTQSPEPICQGSYGYVYCNLSQGNGTLTYNWSASDLPAGAYITPMGNKCKVTYSYSSLAKDGGTNQIMAPLAQIYCTVSNSAGSDNDSMTPSFSTNCGGCPTIAFEENGVIENENTILTKSVISQKDVTDYYLIQKEFNKTDKEKKFIIHEPEEEHTYLDQIELLEVKVNPNEYVAVTENGEVISYKLSKKGIEFINGNKDDLENTLSSIDDNVTDFSSGDSLLINSESLSASLNNEDMYLLFVGIKPPIKEQSVAELTTSDLNESAESTQLYARPNKSVFGVKLGKKLSNTMKIKFHQNVEVDFISVVKNEKTAKVDKLKLIEAVHSENGKVIEQLSAVDEKYSEILPGEKISFVFESKNNTDEKVSYILKSVGRYEEAGLYKNSSESKTNETVSVPTETKLLGNYPNPFNPTTQISYQLKEAAEVTIKIYDVLGKEVKTLVDGFKEEGYHQVSFDASSLSSGIYFYTMKTKEKYDIKKMLLVR